MKMNAPGMLFDIDLLARRPVGAIDWLWQHSFDEPVRLDRVARMARDWFLRYLDPIDIVEEKRVHCRL